jgi:nanoRNase/pAp phosphatase (c-di-AMP/oligoRNAs hydrolase)
VTERNADVEPTVPVELRLERLGAVLGDATTVGVVCHDDPDPDCLASALAFGSVARALGVRSVDLLYDGTLSHQQNRTMVRTLGIELREYGPGDVEAYDATALVDHAVPGVKNRLPEHHVPTVVVDHHAVEEVEGTYVDHQPTVGATATLLTEYADAAGMLVDSSVATTLLFGIRRETLGLTRGATRREFAAARRLYPMADLDVIRRLSQSRYSAGTLDGIGAAITNRRRRDATVVSHVGTTPERACIPEAADVLLGLDDVETTIVFGLVGRTVYFSARTSGDRHVGRLLDHLFGGVGSAGGHEHMAGGRVPLDAVAGNADDLAAVFERRLAPVVFDALAGPRDPRESREWRRV